MQSFVSLSYTAGAVADVITSSCVQLRQRHVVLLLQEMVLFLQKLPTTEWDEKDIEMVFSRAYMLRASFNDARSHLQS